MLHELEAGRLATPLYYKLEEDIRQLDLVGLLRVEPHEKCVTRLKRHRYVSGRELCAVSFVADERHDSHLAPQVVGSCERLFTSPLPPTMTRHLQRCLLLWLGALPMCLAGSMAPLTIGMWVGITAYIFTGIEDVGSQVEQPFGIVPMNKLSELIQRNVEETIQIAPQSFATDSCVNIEASF